jgi:predicted nucleotide-binding protein (sugar kinase/HSP70/actin superfamily)
VRELERLGAEVVDSSLGEWLNYISYDQARKSRKNWRHAWNEGNHDVLRKISRQWIAQEIEKLYQWWRQNQVYRRALKHLDIQPDHSIGTIERRLNGDRLFNFDVGTEAALSIGGALEYVHDGFDGIVNVFPFTCMPSTICSAILKPLLHQMKIPYLDAPYDGTIQPNREAVLRTFLYQAHQHLQSRLSTGQNGKGIQ